MNKIAVVGVQETVGREILSFLEENGFRAADIIALEPGSPLGNMVSYGEEEDLDVKNLNDFDFAQADIVLFASTAEISKQFAPKALAKNCKVIDCSTAFVSDADVPLVIAGYNDRQISEARRGLVAVPSAAVTQMLVPLQKVNAEYALSRLVISTYTSTSVYGKAAMDEL